MRIYLYISIYLTGFLFYPVLALPQTTGFPEAVLYTIEEGLSQTRITETFIDSEGYLWIGTTDGLNRFDGREFKVYRYQPFEPAGLNNDYIRSITEDEKGNLWIATNEGLNLLDKKTGNFSTFTVPETKDEPVRAVYADRSGFIWCRTLQHIHKLDPFTKEFISYEYFYNDDNPSFTDVDCELVEDLNGLFWFGTKDGLFSFDPVTEGFTHYYHDPLNNLSLSNNQVKTILEDSNGELWIGTDHGLNKFDRMHNSFMHYYVNGSLYNPEAGSTINSITEDDDGILWLSTNQGIAKFHKRNQKFNLLPSLYVHNSPLKLSALNTILLDDSEILWTGGFQGLFKVDLKPDKFKLYNTSLRSSPRLTSEMVSAIYKDTDGLLWVGLWDNGIDLIDRDKGTKVNLSADHPDHGRRLPSNNYREIYSGSGGLIWLGSSEGIDIFDRQAKIFFSFDEYFRPVPEDFTKSLHIYTIREDQNNDVWIGTDKGLFRYRRRINTLIGYNDIFNDSINIEIGPVYSIVVEKNNKIWLGTARNGLVYFDTEKNVFYHYDDDVNGEFPWTNLNSIYKDSRNLLWIGTPSGLTCFNFERNNFIHYTERDGLPNNFIYRILEDRDSMLWLSTNKGISKLDPKSGKFTNYGVSEGLQSYEFNFGSAFQSNDGEMFFGGIAGLNAFYPDDLPVNPRIPPVVITNFEIIDADHNEEIYVGMDNPVVTVKFNESFTIDFAALDFTHPDKNRYRYSLTELEKKPVWISVGSQNSLTFSNLSSGEYIFRVRGSNNDNLWNTEGAQLKLIVEAPFWRTGIAYFIYFFIVMALMFSLIQVRTQSLRRSNRILRERDIAAREVAKQKELLSKRNKNIEDSLNYAQRIQKAMLTTPGIFESVLPESFILHKPKDIVSGDFYWISEVDNKIFVAAVDCTGHGVPGAFMSLIGFELFRKIINMQRISEPGKILNAMNANMEEVFGNVGDITLKDGMDLAFCVIDKENMLLEFAGAFNPLYLVRDNKLTEIKADRFSVGADRDPEDPVKKVFKTHRIRINPDDMIYIFTDGFADQFGGPEGKKYKYRRFRHLLLTIHKLPLKKQKQYLDDSIEEWKGNIEQIDDILVIGIKPRFN